jgi:hypothetical protein
MAQKRENQTVWSGFLFFGLDASELTLYGKVKFGGGKGTVFRFSFWLCSGWYASIKELLNCILMLSTLSMNFLKKINQKDILKQLTQSIFHKTLSRSSAVQSKMNSWREN